MRSKFYVPTTGPSDWSQLLADPEKQWRDGYSAQMLADRWEGAQGFPPEVVRVFQQSGSERFQRAEMLLGIPEHQVDLPGGRQPSQTDLFVLAKSGAAIISIAVEGKVEEQFDEFVVDWMRDQSPSGHSGKPARLAAIQAEIGLSGVPVDAIRYQLLHRAASAVLEAKRFNASAALLLVHSFSKNSSWFQDFEDFVGLYGRRAAIDSLVFLTKLGDVELYATWVKG